MNPKTIKLTDKPEIYAKAMETLEVTADEDSFDFSSLYKDDLDGYAAILDEAKKKLSGGATIDFVGSKNALGELNHFIFIDKVYMGSVNSTRGAQPVSPGTVKFFRGCGSFRCETSLDALELAHSYIQKNIDMFAKYLAGNIKFLREQPQHIYQYTKDEIHAQIKDGELTINNVSILTIKEGQVQADNANTDVKPTVSKKAVAGIQDSEVKSNLLEDVESVKKRYLSQRQKIENYGDAFKLFDHLGNWFNGSYSQKNINLYKSMVKDSIKQTKIGYDLNANVRVDGLNVDYVFQDVCSKLIDNINHFDMAKIKSKKDDNSNDSGMSI